MATKICTVCQIAITPTPEGLCPVCGKDSFRMPTWMKSDTPRAENSHSQLEGVRPLGDPLLSLRRFMHWMLIILGFGGIAVIAICLWIEAEESRRFREALDRAEGFNFPSLSAGEITAFNEVAIIPAFVAVVGFCPMLIEFLILLPRRAVNALYLRSFRHDPKTGRIRVALANVFGFKYRISGIRDPRRRWSLLHYIGIAFFVLRYITPRYMNLEAGADWKRRLWKSLSGTRCLFLDLTDMTPSVGEELRLAVTAIELRRILFIGNETRSEDEWRDLVVTTFEAELPKSEIHVAIWRDTGWWPDNGFVQAVKTFRDQLPAGFPDVSAASQELAVAGYRPEETATLHGWGFVRDSLLVALVANIAGLVVAFFSPTLTNLAGVGVSIAAYTLLFWMLLMYLIECGSMLRRVVVLTPILLLAGYYSLLLGAINQTRISAQNQLCRNNLKQLGLSLQMYEDDFRHLPTAQIGEPPRLSGRVLLLKHLGDEYASIGQRFDETKSWNSPENQPHSSSDLAKFACPTDMKRKPGGTNYFFSYGEGFAFDPKMPRLSISDVSHRDGSSHTMGMFERHGENINWAEPRDPALLGDEKQSWPRHGQSVNVLMLDGSIRSIRQGTDPAIIRAMQTRDGGEFVPFE